MVALNPDQMLSIVRSGLGRTEKPKKVLIVGAGMAGLVAGLLLREAGHLVKILEASEKVGGRVLTFRSPFTPGLYFNAGAMRIPSTHRFIFEYIRRFNLSVIPFINSTPEDWIYVNGVQIRRRQYQENPDLLGIPVAPKERGKTAEQLVRGILRSVESVLRRSPQKDGRNITKQMGMFPFDTFLKINPYGITLSSEAVEMIRIILDVQGLSEHSFLDVIRILNDFLDPRIRYLHIEGGMDRLPYMFYQQLKNHIHFHRKMTRIVYSENKITIHTQHTKTFKPSKYTADYAIIAIPFSTLRMVEVEPFHAFSYFKRKAIRELHYAPATKIGIEFQSRFWEYEGICGGQTITDLPIRFTYYPSDRMGHSEPGVLLSSYTWEDDTLVWDSLPEEERISQTLENLSVIHGNLVYQEFVTGISKSWTQDPYLAGGFVLFKPGQESEIEPYISSPEGRVHFAGEHTSGTRAWIEGAIESGVRAAYEVHHARE